MHRLTLAALVCLIGCSSSQPDAGVAFRAAEAPIYSAAILEQPRLAGRWIQVAGFSESSQNSCSAGAAEFGQSRSGTDVDAQLCLNGRKMRVAGALIPTGPGRFAVAGMEDWWVLWVDSDYRTLVIGTPSGRFGFVLDRGEIAPDRLTAATEIFDFNGYTTTALKAF